MDPNVQKSWEDFLNPALLRARLISASVYIAGYEFLKDAIVDRVRDFFWTGFDDSDDKIDPEYQSDVLSRNKSPLYASLDWLREMGAIDAVDITCFDRIKMCRNTLAHRLLSTLGPEGMPTDFVECFQTMVTLLHKIEVWWIKEFEIPTNPYLHGKQIDEDGIRSGRVMAIQMLCDIALGDETKSRFYYDELRKRAGGNQPTTPSNGAARD